MDNFQVSTRCVVSDDERAIRLAQVYDLILRLKDDRPVGRLVGTNRDTDQGTHASFILPEFALERRSNLTMEITESQKVAVNI